MNPSIVASFLFVISFGVCYAGIFRWKKAEQPLNGVIWVVLNLITELCYGAFVGGILNAVRVPINLWTMSGVYLVLGIVALVKVYRDNAQQTYKWKLYDFIYVGFMAIFVLIVMLKTTTFHLNLVFMNSDAAVHLKNAMHVVTSQQLPTMFYTELHNAMIFEVFLPWISRIYMYKVFMVIDLVALFLQAVMFMMCIREYMSNKVVKFLSLCVGALYVLGYPLNSFMFNFHYWGIGIMLIGFVLLMLRSYGGSEIDRGYALVNIMMGCNAVTMCYMIFGPGTFIATFLVLLMYQRREGKLVSLDTVLLEFKVFIIPTIIAVYYCYFQFLKKESFTVSSVMTILGGSYMEFFIDFIFVLPVVLYVLVRQVRRKRADENTVFLMTFAIFLMVLVKIYMDAKISPYYFFKCYFPIWFFMFIMAMDGINQMYEEAKEILVAGILLFAFLFVMSFGNVENRLLNAQTMIMNQVNRSDEFFNMYRYNRALVQDTQIRYSDEYMEGCAYVMDELKGEEVPVITNIYNYEKCYWYEAITGQDCSRYYLWHFDIDNIKGKLAESDVNYFMVYKDSQVYEENKDWMNQYKVVFENNTVMIAATK